MLMIKNLDLTFNKNSANEKHALKSINLEVKKGEFITIIGGNGAGKSTLLNCLGGTYQQDSGQIILEDTKIHYEKEYKRAKYIGRLFQDPLKGTAPDMSIEENITLSYFREKNTKIFDRLFKIGLSKEEKKEVVQKLAELELGLESRMKSHVGLLSGGQRQALTLVMATINLPKLLLLDEHTAALDPQTAHKVMELTDSIVKDNKLTTLMVTHNIKHAIKYGNRLIVMKDGQIILDLDNEKKSKLSVEDVMNLYSDKDGNELSDSMILD